MEIIRVTMKGCANNIATLQTLLRQVEKEGNPQGLGAKLRSMNRQMLYIFHSKKIQDTNTVLHNLRDDLKLAINLLNLYELDLNARMSFTNDYTGTPLLLAWKIFAVF